MSKLVITSDTTTDTIKNWFSDKFPLLKIEFYATEHQIGEGSSNSSIVTKNTSIADIGYKNNSNDKEVEIIIFEDYSTNLVEHIFKSRLNLNIQIFRFTNNHWIQTTATDNWTIKEQMERAQFHENEKRA